MPTPTNAAASGFIPQIWASRAISLFRKKIVLVRLVRRDTEYGEFKKGDTLKIPYFGTLTAQEKTAGNPATTQEPVGGSTVEVTLNKFKYVDIEMPDVVKAQANEALMDAYLDPMVDALAQDVEKTLFALYAGFSQVIGTSGTALNYDTILEAREKLNDADVPFDNRALIYSTKDETAILKDPDLKEYIANQRGEAVREGSIGRVAGFDMYMSNLVPKVGNAPVSVKNLAIHRDAMILATRALEAPPADSGCKSASSTDPESGLTLRALSQYSMSDRATRLGLDILYGVKELRDVSGVVVQS